MQGTHRLRFEYGKDERLAFLGHLEVMSAVMRSIRRADLPFALGNGFAHRMRIQFAQALPVGASSACEYFDLQLTERLGAHEALGRLAAATPSALAPTRCAYVEVPQPALEAWLTRASWLVEVRGTDAGALERAIREVWRSGAITYQRGQREKTVDLASTLVSLEVGEREGGALVRMGTRSSNLGALRPAALVDAAIAQGGLAPYEALLVRRVGQWHEEDGRLVEPL